MRFLPVLLALTAAAAGCGSGTKDVAKSARPCLEQLGDYVHHVARVQSPSQTVPTLPVPDPDARVAYGLAVPQLPWPKDFQEYGEVLYPTNRRGANAVQVLIFGDDDLPRRVLVAHRRPNPRPVRTALPVRNLTAGQVWTQVGQALVIWSSKPTPSQRADVGACLA